MKDDKKLKDYETVSLDELFPKCGGDKTHAITTKKLLEFLGVSPTLDTQTLWMDVESMKKTEGRDYIAFRAMNLNGRKYIFIPKGTYISRLNDDIHMLIETDKKDTNEVS